ncbi:MAG: methylated-DNA--[protein]-cysteine S-methyltransferase [Vampirovibrionales bacterium]|nr:methylated-DNA--[protein]-cysteine S-methyltransferase [Vampirovibrionales bacterium]
MNSSSSLLSIHTPWGWLWVDPNPSHQGWAWAQEASGRQRPESAEEETLLNAFTAYTQGDDATLMAWPLPHTVGTPFQRAVWSDLLAIPKGKTASYGEVAKRVAQTMGQKPAPQAVGQACRNNPWPLRVPCHRVISTAEQQGKTGFVGYAGHTLGYLPAIKTQLLAWEQQLLPNTRVESTRH